MAKQTEHRAMSSNVKADGMGVRTIVDSCLGGCLVKEIWVSYNKQLIVPIW